MKKLTHWVGIAICLVAVAIVLSVSGCAWIKAGEDQGVPTSVRDGQDESEIDVDGPIESNDSAPPVNELP